MRRLPLILAVALLAACGQTGPLYLPDEGIVTPVETHGPASPAPAEEGSEEPAEPDGDEPPGPTDS